MNYIDNGSRLALSSIKGTSVGKPKGRHLSRALSGMFVHEVGIPGLYPDGDCLYLKVDSLGFKRWILRTIVQGKRRDMGLGSFTQISLFEARARAQRLRRIARQGGDPFAQREQVFSVLHPEVTQAVSKTLDLLREVGVVVDKLAPTKLRAK